MCYPSTESMDSSTVSVSKDESFYGVFVENDGANDSGKQTVSFRIVLFFMF